jgi:hypothetical protein
MCNPVRPSCCPPQNEAPSCCQSQGCRCSTMLHHGKLCRLQVVAHLTVLGLQGRLQEWLLRGVGIQVAGLLPSVRCGLEAALLSALAAAAGGAPLAALLSPAEAAVHLSATARVTSDAAGSIEVCGLVDSFPSAEATAAAAVQLVQQGHTTLKLKVIERAQPPCTMKCSPIHQGACGMSVHV